MFTLDVVLPLNVIMTEFELDSSESCDALTHFLDDIK